MSKRSKLVRSVNEALENILSFQDEFENSPGLRARAPYARAWYARRGEGGKWVFGPSKFIGYVRMTASEYLQSASNRDGRLTEVRLQEWFALPPSPAVEEELEEALRDWLDEYEVAPSKKARIRVHPGDVVGAEGGGGPRLLELLIEVARGLTSEQRRALRDAL